MPYHLRPWTLVSAAIVVFLALLLLDPPRTAAAASSRPSTYAPVAAGARSAPAPIVVTGVFDLRNQPLQPGTQAVVRADGDCLRLRSGAGLDAGVITCLPDGSSVLVMPATQVSGQYRWQLVSAGSTVGWVADEFLDEARSTSACTAPDAQMASIPPGLTGQLPARGFGIVRWGGGTADGIVTAALSHGCSPTSLWAQRRGQGSLVGFLTHAPPWVNREWQAQYPTGDVPAGTILMVLCGGAADHASVPVTIASATAPHRIANTVAPETHAAAVAVIDGDSGTVLYGDREHEHLAPASLTKMTTAIVGIEGAETSQWVLNTVDSRALVGSSVMGLRPGDCFQLRDLLYGLMLPSGNDAALAIAGYVGGSTSAFVHEMNTFVQRLGLQDTQYTDPHGLGGPDHYSSAYDLAMIARYGMTLPLFRTIVGTRQWEVQGSRDFPLYTLNKFLTTYPGADGLKTGYTEKAGRTLAVSAVRDGHRVIVVVLDDADRYGDAQSLMDWAFSTFAWQ